MAENPNARVLMGDDPRLPAKPEKPTLIDFFKYHFGPPAHILQSAKHAVNAGLSENMVLACLLHDISTIGSIRGDHGYCGAQLVEPYVEEEVSWAIRAHQVLRFYPNGHLEEPSLRCYQAGVGPARDFASCLGRRRAFASGQCLVIRPVAGPHAGAVCA
jgi:hypothetical protein